MGSPLSPIASNLYMEHFKTKAFNSFPLKPDFWFRYLDETNVKWPHGNDNVNNFVEHLNSQSTNIHFTMELEENNSILFLDVLISKKLMVLLPINFFVKGLILGFTFMLILTIIFPKNLVSSTAWPLELYESLMMSTSIKKNITLLRVLKIEVIRNCGSKRHSKELVRPLGLVNKKFP